MSEPRGRLLRFPLSAVVVDAIVEWLTRDLPPVITRPANAPTWTDQQKAEFRRQWDARDQAPDDDEA